MQQLIINKGPVVQKIIKNIQKTYEIANTFLKKLLKFVI